MSSTPGSAAVRFGSDRCAGERDLGVAVQAQGRPGQGDLQRAGIGRIADQCLGQAQRGQVRGAGAPDAEMRQSGPTAILQAGQQPGRQHLDHASCSDNAVKVAVSMARKRTRRPGVSRAGAGRAASNSRSGVRPIRRHPPGRTDG